ncbi:hypothetical protein [uncultured Robinsoniella sp.]|uniref:hypothetical protein n=1 Tax=uncultured Robinsoniella sp. TaxID=904190 RepID=UPI00374EBABE
MFFRCTKPNNNKYQNEKKNQNNIQKNIQNKIRKVKNSLPAMMHKIISDNGRMSLSILRKGSLTIEAAMSLPLFLFAMISVLYFIQIVDISVRLTGAICETGNEMAVYAYVKEAVKLQGGSVSDIITGGLSAAYAKGKIKSRGRLEENKGSLSLLRSSFLKEGQMIDLAGTYQVKYPVTLLPIKQMKIAVRGRVRAWTGRDGVNGDGSADGDGAMVLITVNGKVYHKDPECTHIKLSIKPVDKDSIQHLRNESGGKYYPCGQCPGGSNTVYITNTGDKYHSSLGCSGLKRGILLVPMSEVTDWQPCSRCGQ